MNDENHDYEKAPSPFRIARGKNAKTNEFPWMAALVYETSNGKPFIFCGGSIISPNVILTVAHCLIDAEYKGKIF